MTSSIKLTLMLCASAAYLTTALPLQAQDDARVSKDLATVIALQGQPCGGVIEFSRLGENDYLATCQSGDRYRVFTDAAERVVVKKQ